MRTLLPAIVLALIGPFGCPDAPKPDGAEAPKSDGADEEAQPPPTPATPEPDDAGAEGAGESADGTPSEAAPQPLTADVEHSKVGFAVARAMIGHVGHFEQFSASLELAEGRPAKLQIEVETGSVVADRPGLTSHLKSGDFFDVEKFPAATFTSEKLVPQPEDEPNTYLVSGTMRLHGVERELEFPATLVVEAEQVVGEATLDISAKAFGIDYEGMEAELAEDAVSLEVELVFPRVAAP